MVLTHFTVLKESFLDLLNLLAKSSPAAKDSNADDYDAFMKTLIRDSYLSTTQISPLEVMIETTKTFLRLIASMISDALAPKTHIEAPKLEIQRRPIAEDEEP